MKRSIIILISILSLTLMFSCEDDQVGPTLDVSKAEPSVITTPEDGMSLVLLFEDAQSVFSIEWTAADYKTENLPDVKYTVLLSYPAENTEVTLASTTSLSTQFTYQSLNYLLFDLGLEPNEEGLFVLRVISSISDNSTKDNLSSDSLSLALTPFDAAPPPITPIYILGDATIPGWNNANALEMTHIEDGIYEIVTTLDGDYFKFISVLGKWAPQWGTDATGTSESGPLVYRPTEAVTDPPAIPAPAEAGEYLIVADTANLVYSVAPVTKKLYLIGNATNAGWNFNKALPANLVAPFKYSITTTLKPGINNSFTFISKPTESAPHLKVIGNSNEERGTVVFEYSPMDAENAISAPSVEGTYQIDIDLRRMSYSIKKVN